MRIKITLSYDGTQYCGWQVQPEGITVQQVLEDALLRSTGTNSRVTGSGRTDSGVHAKGQVAHFDTDSTIPPERFYKALNVHLPSDVRVLSSERAPDDFHACRDVKKKTYEYSLYLSETELPLKERYAVRIDEGIDVHKMQSAAALLIGEHDFKAFCASGSSAKTTERTLFAVDILQSGCDIKVRVSGNGFLYNMVRIIVGTLLDVGYGKKTEKDILEMLNEKKRQRGGKTLPAKGLCLISAEY